MKEIFFVLLFPLQLIAQNFSPEEISRWEKEAVHVNIIRDEWGIPHVYGKTDADAVFGLLYAQCEDDFKRIEMNYVEKLGRLSEINGEKDLYNDLLIRLVIDSADAIKDYKNSLPWLHQLLNAFADGINYYLYKNPSEKPALLKKFEPWYPLLWTDGSIGAINSGGVSTEELKNFYSDSSSPMALNLPHLRKELTGSNGFAIAASKTASGNSILYINPHVTYYFRPEVQMSSGEGLSAYGAITWGQFFVYQGFNEHCGWMHTSTRVDVADLYAEKVTKKNNEFFYLYNNVLKPVRKKRIVLHYKSGETILSKMITAYFTEHGPVMAKRNDQWLSLKAINRDMNGLIQSWRRTKSNSFADFKKTMDLRTNMSNNTVYADAEKNIAYWHGNFVPIRDKKFDWSRPVDGSIAATQWKGVHKVDETVHIYNPENGWLQNCNSTPFTAAGTSSPRKENYPAYMAPDGENFRAINAVRLLTRENNYNLDKIIALGYDTYQPAFEILLPALFRAFGNLRPSDTIYRSLLQPVNVLKNWNRYSSDTSVATALAVTWGEKLSPAMYGKGLDEECFDQVKCVSRFADTASAELLLSAFSDAINSLKNNFGRWEIGWGEINRFQRLASYPAERFDDNLPSLPVGRTSSEWGTIPAFESSIFPGTKKRYGFGGNSFICAVQFGKRVTAKSLLTGGESGNDSSLHFNDQAAMFSKGEFKDVLFYKDDVMKHAKENYHPGELKR